jgi:hypothetical protein
MMSGADIWELRWIAGHLPAFAEAPVFGGPALRAIDEQDVYLLTRSDHINLKIRHRGNAVKLKRLNERSVDGFERWRTEFDAPLPAGAQRFREVLELIGRAGPADRLGAAASADEAVELLAAICDPQQMVTVYKTRQLFQQGACRLDIVRFRTEAGNYNSLGVESSSLSDLRAVVRDLALGTLGTPCNYMEFLRSL